MTQLAHEKTSPSSPPRAGRGDTGVKVIRPERPWYLTFTGIVILVIIITIPAAIVAALLGRLGFGQPQEPPTPEPIGRRIEYKELLRDVEQYLDLYRLGLPPFDVMKQQARQFHLPLLNATVQVKTDRRPGRSKA